MIHGMLAGIGVLILSSQFHVMVDDAPRGNGIQNLVSIPESIQKGLPLRALGAGEDRRLRRDFMQQFAALSQEQMQLHELLVAKVEAAPVAPSRNPWPAGRR